MASPITLRWRIHEGVLPLRQRHMRALNRLGLTEALIGWIHERLEWAMLNMLETSTEAVLVLSIDPAAEVRLSLEEVQPAPQLNTSDLCIKQGRVTGIYSAGQLLAGDVWLAQDGQLLASTDEVYTATSTLCQDLATTLGVRVLVEPQVLSAVQQAAGLGKAFLIVDEFGFIPISQSQEPVSTSYTATNIPINSTSSSITERIRQAFARLW
ncbi:MAG: hypothetical protein LBU61_06670 [Coriobacteriales bacterium]|jgi:hypothetical protein|nr:hypothetical protein [Coriobacteriales bacterium]